MVGCDDAESWLAMMGELSRAEQSRAESTNFGAAPRARGIEGAALPASSNATAAWQVWIYDTAKKANRARPRHTDKATLAVAYLGIIFCVACLSKSPSFPAIAQCWLSVEPACRERLNGSCLGGLVVAAGFLAFGEGGGPRVRGVDVGPGKDCPSRRRQRQTAAGGSARGGRWRWMREEEG